MATADAPDPDDPWGDPGATTLWRDLVRIHPSNLEDPVRGRYEKPRYAAAVTRITSAARGWGLAVSTFDPSVANPDAWHGAARPNLVIDLDVGAPSTVLLLAHYDVVPVPEEQLGRWRSPPTELTRRPDGRWYGRGANDDLGSGVTAALLAMKRLDASGAARRNVRLLVCCDEETGGEGGIESLKHHDAALPERDPARFVRGDVALIPDGAPHATAGSSGVAFLDADFLGPATLARALAFGERLESLDEEARRNRSRFPSPDYPDAGAPFPVISGRATVTRFDFASGPGPGARPTLRAAHAETDATNFIPESVTIAISGPEEARADWSTWAGTQLPAGFRLSPAGPTAISAAAGAVLYQVVGAGGHGGSPHRAHNPVPVALALLRASLRTGRLSEGPPGTATYGVDLRLIPEMPLAEGLDPALAAVRRWAADRDPEARIAAPPARCRRGYAMALDHPDLGRLARILESTLGAHGIYGEYGGTDASSLADVRTPNGAPLPAIVFGSMDPAARIHDAEESADPRLLLGVSRSIERFVSEP